MSLSTDLLQASISNADPSDPDTFIHRWDWLIAEERNAIIEECARVVDNWTKWENLAAIAAAIRALKDKP